MDNKSANTEPELAPVSLTLLPNERGNGKDIQGSENQAGQP